MQATLKFNPLQGRLRNGKAAISRSSLASKIPAARPDRSVVTMASADAKQTMVNRAAQGLAGAGMSLAAAALTASPALADVIMDENVFSDFNVDFLGFPIDHKTIVYAVVVSQFIGTIGAFVGGSEARKKTIEVQRLNKQILEVNRQLRSAARQKQEGPWTKNVVEGAKSDTESCEKVDEVLLYLRAGKQRLKDKQPDEARQQFEKALVAVRNAGGALDSPWRAERKALRGLGAAYTQQGKYEEALTYLFKVLEISEENRDYTGKGDAYGVIADIYTDLGDFAKAAYYYDGMISLMNEDPMISMDA